MPAKKKAKPSGEKHPPGIHTVEGHSVEIREREGNEELRIDGERQRFFVTEDGYTLHADAYVPPQKTLLEAVKIYLRKHPKIGHDH